MSRAKVEEIEEQRFEIRDDGPIYMCGLPLKL